MAGRVEEHEVPPTRMWETPVTGLADQVREEWCGKAPARGGNDPGGALS